MENANEIDPTILDILIKKAEARKLQKNPISCDLLPGSLKRRSDIFVSIDEINQAKLNQIDNIKLKELIEEIKNYTEEDRKSDRSD